MSILYHHGLLSSSTCWACMTMIVSRESRSSFMSGAATALDIFVDNSTQHQLLLLPKYLYVKGADIVRAGGMFDAGLAISLFMMPSR